MIIIKNKDCPQTLLFPKHVAGSQNKAYTLVLKSESTHKEFSFIVTDEDDKRDFYTFTLDLSELEESEYNYLVVGDIESVGLLKIKTNTIEEKEYEEREEYTYYEG